MTCSHLRHSDSFGMAYLAPVQNSERLIALFPQFNAKICCKSPTGVGRGMEGHGLHNDQLGAARVRHHGHGILDSAASWVGKVKHVPHVLKCVRFDHLTTQCHTIFYVFTASL